MWAGSQAIIIKPNFPASIWFSKWDSSLVNLYRLFGLNKIGLKCSNLIRIDQNLKPKPNISLKTDSDQVNWGLDVRKYRSDEDGMLQLNL